MLFKADSIGSTACSDRLRRAMDQRCGLFHRVARLTRELSEAREQQSATSEILRVISSSPAVVQPVFDAIVRSAVRLCNGVVGAVNTFDGELTHVTRQQVICGLRSVVACYLERRRRLGCLKIRDGSKFNFISAI
jgi:hypothetical protein